MGFKNPEKKDIIPLNVGKIQEWIDLGRLKPNNDHFITIRDLMVCGLITNPQDGVKLLAKVGL